MKIPLSGYLNYVGITNALCFCMSEWLIKSSGGLACEQAIPGLQGKVSARIPPKLSTRNDSQNTFYTSLKRNKLHLLEKKKVAQWSNPL